jgi:hypothetical protein
MALLVVTAMIGDVVLLPAQLTTYLGYLIQAPIKAKQQSRYRQHRRKRAEFTRPGQDGVPGADPPEGESCSDDSPDDENDDADLRDAAPGVDSG